MPDVRDDFMVCTRPPTKQFLAKLALLCWVMLVGQLLADGDDEPFLEGLRNRQLFDLAETFCRQRLANDQLADEDRAQLTTQWIRVLVARSANSPPHERDVYWTRAHRVAEDFVNRHADHPRKILIQVQDALTFLARGELIRQELEAGEGVADGRQLALEQLRAGIRSLEELDEQLSKEIPLRRRRDPAPGELSADELFALQNDIRYQLARGYRNRALCYDADSIDRVDALTQVTEQHQQLLKQLPNDDPLRWPVRLETIVCLRLLGKFDLVRQLLATLETVDAPGEILLRARAESVRLELAQGRPQAALTILEQGRRIAGRVSDELDFAHLETYDALARASANDEAAAAQWQKKALAFAQLIEQTHGPYWARRANLLLVRWAAERPAAQDVDILHRLAEELFNQGQLEQAIQAYDRAARQAHANQDVQQAFILFYTAARVEHGRGRHREASRRFRQLSLLLPSHAQASAAHLAAVWNTAQTVNQSDAELSAYTELLEEHLALWPDEVTADTARMWLGRVRQQEGAWTEAIDIYLELSPASTQLASAVDAALLCSQQHFAELRMAGQPFVEQAKLMAARFEDVIYDSRRQLPTNWSLAQRTAAVASARIRLQFIPDDHATAGAILEAAWNASPAAPDAWKTTVRSLRVVALAGQPNRRAEAAKILSQVANASPQLLLEMLEGLAGVAQSARSEAQTEIAKLQLDAMATLSAAQTELGPASQWRLAQIEADALALTGRRDEALVKYESLAKQHEKNARIQEGYARLLQQSDQQGTLQRALAQWRKVDRGSRPGTERWYRAKYSIALIHYQLGEKNRARQLIEYLQKTPPGLDATSLNMQFENLLMRCRE